MRTNGIYNASICNNSISNLIENHWKVRKCKIPILSATSHYPSQWEILTFFLPKFKNVQFRRDFFFNCRLLVWLLVWLSLGFGDWNLSSWGCQEGQCDGTSLVFSWKITESYQLFGISRLRRLHFTCSVELNSWWFFGGSIDTSKNSCSFNQK